MTNELMNSNEDEENKIILTNEAQDLLEKYISSVSVSFKEIGLNKQEVKETINDVQEHILKLGAFYAGDKAPVSTDLVKRAIKKLGDPEVIKKSLIEEEEFLQAAKPGIKPHGNIQRTLKKQPFGIRVITLVRLFSLLSWILTSSVVFYLFGYQNFIEIGLLSYIIIVILLLTIPSAKIYETNNLLNSKIKMNFHIVFLPLFALGIKLTRKFDPTILDPIIIIAWLILHTSKQHINFYVESAKRTFKVIKRKPNRLS